MHADDATVHCASKTKSTVRLKLQSGTCGFQSWCLSNNMFIHIQKTSIMWIGTWQNLQCFDSLNEIIQQVETQKLLGLIIDRSLNWDDQINAFCLNITRRITLLKQLSKCINKSNLKLSYNSYILPIFDYECILWSCTSALKTNRLFKLKKRAARIILGVDIITPSGEMFKDLYTVA